MSITARPTGIKNSSVFDIDTELRKGFTKKANFDEPTGLINQSLDSDKILLLGQNGYTVTKGTAGEYLVSNGPVVRLLPDLKALLAYSGEPKVAK